MTTRTTGGKAKMGNNALRHGLTSKHAVIDEENPAEYQALREELLNDWNPATHEECQLVIEIAESSWRMRRARRLEVQLFETDMRNGPDPDAALAECFHANAREFDNLRRHTTAIERGYYRALTQLAKLQKERKKSTIGFVSQKRRQCSIPSLNSKSHLCNTPPEPIRNGSVSQIPGDSQ